MHIPILKAAIPPILAVASLVSYLGLEKWDKLAPAVDASAAIPTTAVKRGDVPVTVTARGELQGGNSQSLAAPMTGGRDMIITELRSPGELVDEKEVVVQFDTTEQEFDLKEAEADLAEAEQQVIQATAESEAKEEEARYALSAAKAQVTLAELEARKNTLLATIAARQNEIAVEAAQARLSQLQRDLADQAANSKAGIAIQEAARNKAQVKADTARRAIESMTLRAQRRGYVSVQQNSQQNFMYWGMQLPVFQVGDTVRAGMNVAQIPDLDTWEVTATIGELDRGNLAEGQPAAVSVVALPGRQLKGAIKNIGGTTGPPWDRRFDCRISLANPIPELRPGMSAQVVITTRTVSNALWIPSQALFESNGRSFVYRWADNRFQPVDVKLVTRSETRAVVEGIPEGQVVALASPDQMQEKKSAGGVMKALQKR